MPARPGQRGARCPRPTVRHRPGDAVLLKRGCTWTGPLRVKWSGTAAVPSRRRLRQWRTSDHPEPLRQRGHHRLVSAHRRPHALGRRGHIPDVRTPVRDGERASASVQALHTTSFAILSPPSSTSDFLTWARTTIRSSATRSPTTTWPTRIALMRSCGHQLAGDDNEMAYNTISGATSVPASAAETARRSRLPVRRNVIHHNCGTTTTSSSSAIREVLTTRTHTTR